MYENNGKVVVKIIKTIMMKNKLQIQDSESLLAIWLLLVWLIYVRDCKHLLGIF